MTYRKGELTAAAIDRGWPYQVVLDADLCKGKNHDLHTQFNFGTSLCARGHSVMQDGKWYRVFCYSIREDAESFMARFGGEWFEPKKQGRGAKWMTYGGKLTKSVSS
jgi:hypothetical protein